MASAQKGNGHAEGVYGARVRKGVGGGGVREGMAERQPRRADREGRLGGNRAQVIPFNVTSAATLGRSERLRYARAAGWWGGETEGRGGGRRRGKE